jgi:hypothetical protein
MKTPRPNRADGDPLRQEKQMTKETPLQAVKRRFGSKETLVDSIADAVRGASEDAAQAKERLKTLSNKKLLRLAEITQSVKDNYGGSKDKLVDALSQSLGRAKDNDYVTKLRTFSTARLLDMKRAADRRGRRQAS